MTPREMFLRPRKIHEAQVDRLDFPFTAECQHFARCHRSRFQSMVSDELAYRSRPFESFQQGNEAKPGNRVTENRE